MIKWAIGIIAVIMIAGCVKQEPEVVVKNKFVYEKAYGFDTIDLDGVYIDLGSKTVQKMCTDSLVELNTVYRGVIEFYEDQIKRYKEDRYNEKSRHKTGD